MPSLGSRIPSNDKRIVSNWVYILWFYYNLSGHVLLSAVVGSYNKFELSVGIYLWLEEKPVLTWLDKCDWYRVYIMVKWSKRISDCTLNSLRTNKKEKN